MKKHEKNNIIKFNDKIIRKNLNLVSMGIINYKLESILQEIEIFKKK